GMAGGHKHRWMYVIKYMPDHFGRRGFRRHPSLIRRYTTINVGEISKHLKKWEELGVVKKKGKSYEVDLGALGYDKLLGAGKINVPIVVKVERASRGAVEKIESAGGEVKLPEAE
ncbi:MAG: uL15 family ribosomal protein, partial [Thermoplasmata archaeon]|nr:uL15 family ribosomal protein [Thermoplasmata archaeon]